MTTAIELNGCLDITSIDADWDYASGKPSHWAERPRLLSIEFHPGSASDRMVIKESEEGGPQRFDSGEVDSSSDSRIKYFHGVRVRPFIDFSECTLSAGHRVIIETWRES